MTITQNMTVRQYDYQEVYDYQTLYGRQIEYDNQALYISQAEGRIHQTVCDCQDAYVFQTEGRIGCFQNILKHQNHSKTTTSRIQRRISDFLCHIPKRLKLNINKYICLAIYIHYL